MTPLMPSSSLELSDLDELYRFYNSRKWVHPDPLEFLYRYPDPKDREIVGLLASCLAYGRVRQILKSVSAALEKLGPSPHAFVLSASAGRLKRSFANFRHRFTTGDEFTALLIGFKEVVLRHGSLYRCFLRGSRPEDDTVLPALSGLIHEIKALSGRNGSNSMIPLPEKGSACKRLNLFLRWMVRKDRVDPGGWDGIDSAKLIVPLDTHMYRISLELGLTRRKSADMRTALEITREFRRMCPRDPVRFDFALTRLGIRKPLNNPRRRKSSVLEARRMGQRENREGRSHQKSGHRIISRSVTAMESGDRKGGG